MSHIQMGRVSTLVASKVASKIVALSVLVYHCLSGLGATYENVDKDNR
jgi:hypothetical protein